MVLQASLKERNYSRRLSQYDEQFCIIESQLVYMVIRNSMYKLLYIMTQSQMLLNKKVSVESN